VSPGALIAPLLVPRLGNVGWLIAAGVLSFALGYLGLLLAPAPLTLLWVLLIGCGSILFPVCLVLINVRTRTHGGTVALSGFAQGTAYALGALGPLLVGLLHDASGGWTLPLLFLLAVTLAAAIPAVTLGRPEARCQLAPRLQSGTALRTRGGGAATPHMSAMRRSV
jgi:CP family cyanate transporter-like MFS transporter